MDQTTTREQPREPEQIAVVVKPSQEEKIQENTTASAGEKQPAASELAEELRKPEIIAEFAKLQALLENTLSAEGQERILQTARQHDYTLPELHHAFRTEGRGFKFAGGLVKFAREDMPRLLAHKTISLASGEAQRAPAAFPIRKAGTHGLRESGYDLPDDPQAVCPLCSGSGYCGTDFCTCDQGRERDNEDYRKCMAGLHEPKRRHRTGETIEVFSGPCLPWETT
jgi:hypothetical protein